MFLTESDYVVISSASLNIVQQADPQIREKAERMACEEVAGYLRSRYDVQRIFAATGDQRNDVIVMRTADIALYHLCSSLAQKMGHEIRKERYELAIKWLEQVQEGKIIPDLPTVTGEDGQTDINNPMIFGSEPKQKYDW